jgi:tetratricopeptide (TPR) repeat protein
MSRPGVARIMDPAVARLLATGEDVGWVRPPDGVTGDTALHRRMTANAEEDVDTASEDGIVSDPEECLAQEERLEERVALLRLKEGLASDRTLKHTFKLMDCLIGQYKLNRTDEILTEIDETCEARGGDWRVKFIQSSAFVKWKQYRFREALDLFLEQQKIVGGSAALCENIGHTYSSLGDLPKAEEYFERAIELLKRGSFGNRGGIYMGLGLVRDRLGKTREALPILQQALEHYQQEHTKDHVQLDSSIIAKAHMSLGKAHEKLGEPAKAASHMSDALAIFRRTVGYDSPLTANAMGSLGKVKAAMGLIKEGIGLLRGAIKLEVAKDAFHLETVWELFCKVKDLHMEEAKSRQEQQAAAAAPADRKSSLATLQDMYAPYIPLVKQARARVTKKHEKDELGTLSVFYKTVGEIFMLAQDYAGGEELLTEALRLFNLVDDFDCSSLIEGCQMLLGIAQSNQRPKAAAAAAGSSSSAPPSVS